RHRRGPSPVGVERPDLDRRTRQPGVLWEVERLTGDSYGPALADDVVRRAASGQELVVREERLGRRTRLHVCLVRNRDVLGAVHVATRRAPAGPDGERRAPPRLGPALD